MHWSEGHTWLLDVQLPVGAVNFKIVMQDQPQNFVRWEQGEDRSVLIPETTTVTGAPVGQVRARKALACGALQHPAALAAQLPGSQASARAHCAVHAPQAAHTTPAAHAARHNPTHTRSVSRATSTT
jgi:hypothetical protein